MRPNAPIIANRETPSFQLPADHWYQIEVSGEHHNTAANLTQVIDTAALQSIVNRFEEDAEAATAPWHGMLIDFDHESLNPASSSRAAGWLMNVRVRDGQLEGYIPRWSTRGKAAVEGGDFRFFSTVYNRADLESLGGGRVRPLRLSRLALTNDPNNRGGRAISNRKPGPGEPNENENQNQKDRSMKEIAKALGLDSGANESAIVAGITELKTSGDAQATELKELKNRNSELLDAQIEADLDAHKLTGDSRGKWKKALVANRSNALELMADLSTDGEKDTGDKESKGRGKSTVHNRSAASTPKDGDKSPKADADDAAKLSARICNRATALLPDHNGNWASAHAAATSELGGE
ncbi:MAG: phage protease [Mycobacterium sp.]